MQAIDESWAGVARTLGTTVAFLVGETASGSVILVYASNMMGPVCFAAFVAVTGRFDVAFMISGALSLLCLPLLRGIDRTPVSGT